MFPIKTLLALGVKLEGHVNSKLCPKDVILGWATTKYESKFTVFINKKKKKNNEWVLVKE